MARWVRLGLWLSFATAAGCSDRQNAGTISYRPNERLVTELRDKPKLQAAVRTLVTDTYGPTPDRMKVPPGAPLIDGGRLLASSVIDLSAHPVAEGQPLPPAVPITRKDPETGEVRPQTGGYALYRKNCLHCHGVSGDGDGPTSEFLWPRPRDFRLGIFKFTSTTGDKPTRDDLRRTIVHGLPSTSMPAFEALLTPAEIEQVLDYVVFLSLRAQTEARLVEEATFDEALFDDPSAASDLAQEVVAQIIGQWQPADAGGQLEVVKPDVPRIPSDRASLLRGRNLFLGQTPEKLQCAGCHGNQGKGDGPSFVPVDVYNSVVFRGRSIDEYDEATRKLWTEGSLDAWGQPLRPANLNNGERTAYKGGRRPIDLYWRIARGINGSKMPAHLTTLKPDQIWDLVNFVLALPYEPELLSGPTGPAPTAAQPTAPTRR